MNNQALEHCFDEMIQCRWENLTEREDVSNVGYMLFTSTISNDALGEISACGASIESLPGDWFRVYDE